MIRCLPKVLCSIVLNYLHFYNWSLRIKAALCEYKTKVYVRPDVGSILYENGPINYRELNSSRYQTWYIFDLAGRQDPVIKVSRSYQYSLLIKRQIDDTFFD